MRRHVGGQHTTHKHELDEKVEAAGRGNGNWTHDFCPPTLDAHRSLYLHPVPQPATWSFIFLFFFGQFVFDITFCRAFFGLFFGLSVDLLDTTRYHREAGSFTNCIYWRPSLGRRHAPHLSHTTLDPYMVSRSQRTLWTMLTPASVSVVATDPIGGNGSSE